MKSGIMPMHSSAIMPSPVFLWRFKVLLFFGWGISCCKIGWDSVMRMNADLRDLFLYEAFLYFNPLLLVTLMIWLWGINLWVFAQSTVSYAKVFDLDHSHLTYQEIWKCATWMTIIVPTSMTAYLYLYSHGEVSLAASQPVILYAVVLMVLISPFDIFYLSPRYYLLRMLWRIILPLQAITFADFFLADILTSMSKVFSDLERSVCRMVNRQEHDFLNLLTKSMEMMKLQLICIAALSSSFSLSSLPKICLSGLLLKHIANHHMVLYVIISLNCALFSFLLIPVATIAWFEADSICGSHSVAIPLVLVFPYLCRLFQCLRQYKDTKEKTSLFNALKYSTAVPVIFMSALKYHILPENWTNFYRPLWLLSSVINSLYSFFWDVTRDWDLSVFSRIFKFKNPHICTNIFYGRQWVYYWVIGSNLILRCTWTYKLSAHLRHNYLTVFTITALEILRRFQWIFFRVENEWNKMTLKVNSDLAMEVIPSEEDRLLGSQHVV